MISVIIPAYNAERFLQACVDSVVGQTARDWEMVIVDDGSTDSTPGICDRAAAGDPRIRVVHKPNGGLSDARNAGIDAARGDRLFFLDADDAVAPDALESLSALAGRHGADIACGGFCSSPGAGAPQSWRDSHEEMSLDPETAVEMMLYQDRLNHSAWGKLYDSRLFDGLRFRKGTWYEDLDLFYRVFLRASRVAFTPRPLYFYRSNPSSFLHSFSLRRADVLGVCDRLCGYMARNRSMRLYMAARDRRLAAAFNVYGLLSVNKAAKGEKMARRAIEARCKEIIRETRWGSLRDPRVRRKNKVGILASYLGGFPLLRLLSRFVYR